MRARITKRMFVLLAALSFVTPVASLAATVVVGTTPIVVPDPNGFTSITPQMRSVFELQKQSVPPNIEQFGAYISASEIHKALGDAGDPNLDRRFDVGAARKSSDRNFTISDFQQFKEIIKTQNDELVSKAKRELPHFMENLNGYIARGSGIEDAISVMDVITLPPHEETARSISYSLFEKFNVTNIAGTPTTHVAAATMTFLYVKGKIIILHCFAEKQGLEWSRAALKQWADAIITANPI
jgi:hypothetical protein